MTATSIHRRRLLIASFLSATLLGVVPAWAATHDGKPKILLHARPVVSKNTCESGALSTCQDAVAQGALDTYYNVFVVVARGNLTGITGMQFGIDYSGGVDINGGLTPISVFSWDLCAWIELVTPTPAWPSPGGGTIILWDDDEPCPTGETNVAGYFYMAAYDPAVMRITERPIDHQLKVANCAQIETVLSDPDDAGYVTFSDTGAPGCNPCDHPCFVVAVEPSTWSRIKVAVAHP